MKKEIKIEMRQPKFHKFVKAIRKDWMLYLLILPMILWFALWVYKPMGGLLIAFKRFKAIDGLMASDFVGLYYFKSLIVDGIWTTQFYAAFRNTFMISLYGLIFGFPIPIILALLFSEIRNETYRKVTQTITYLPHFLSEVTITSLVIMLVYNGERSTGVLAALLMQLGAIGDGVKIIETVNYFRPMYILTGIWKEAGYSSIVYFAAIMGISPLLYEAIRVDGGNKFQEIKFVTFPGMAPTLTIMIILRIGRMLSVGYERIILLYNVNTYETADVLSSFVFRVGLQGGSQALGSAAGMFNALIGFTLVISANFISRRISETSLW